MHHVYKRADSRFWWGVYADSKGKRVARSTRKTTKAEALKVLSSWTVDSEEQKDFSDDVSQVLRSAAKDAERSRMTRAKALNYVSMLYSLQSPDDPLLLTLSSWSEEWLEERKEHVVHHTWESYSSGMRDVMQALGPLADAPLCSLETADFQKVQKKLRKGVKARTTNKKLAIVSGCLNEAMRLGHITRNVAAGVRSLPESDSSVVYPFTLEEVDAMLEVARKRDTPDWEGIITLAVHTGLRQSNIVRLKWNEVELENSRLVLAPVKQRKKRGTPQVMILPLSHEAMAYLKKLPRPIRPTLPVFPSVAEVTKSSICEQFERIQKRAKVPKLIDIPGGFEAKRTFHSFRHTFVTWLKTAQVPEEDRRALAAHSDTAAHQTYTHIPESILRSAIAKLPALSRGGA